MEETAAALNSALGEELGREYVKKHFKPEAKTRMKALVQNLEAAFDKSIDELDWMTKATKAEAKRSCSVSLRRSDIRTNGRITVV